MSQTLLVNPTATPAGLLSDVRRYTSVVPKPQAAPVSLTVSLSTPVPRNLSLPLDIPVPKQALRRRNAVVEAMLEGNILAALSAVRANSEQAERRQNDERQA